MLSTASNCLSISFCACLRLIIYISNTDIIGSAPFVRRDSDERFEMVLHNR